MASQRSGLLRVHVGIGERLAESSAPAVEVDGQRVVGLLEQLALPARELAHGAELAGLGVPELNAKGTPQVATEGERVAGLPFGFARAPTAPGRKQGTSLRATGALPPIEQNRAERVRNLEQLGALGLAARSPSPLEGALCNVECLPVEATEVVRPQPPEAPRNAGHYLTLQHWHPVLLQRVHEGEVADELPIGEDRAFLADLGAEPGHGRIVDRVGRDLSLALEHVEHDPDGLPHVSDRLARFPLRLAVVQRLVHVRGHDGAHGRIAERRESVQPQPGELIVRAAHTVCDPALMHSLCGLLERLRGDGVGGGRGLARE